MLKSYQTAGQLTNELQSKSINIDDIAAYYLKRNRKYKDDLNVHLHFDEKFFIKQFEQQKTMFTDKKPLLAIPIALKDNICTLEGSTTCGSNILKNYQSPYEATVVERLKAAGAAILAKTNLDEFAMGSSNENSSFGPVKNPWDKTRVPGGSSGGSAAAVAADLCPLALGSDTGGSIRQPASFCGVVGFKPSYGRVSRYGLVAYASSLDQIGPLTRSVKDAALVLDIISGHDDKDATSLDLKPVRSLEKISAIENQKLDFSNVKVGVIEEFFRNGPDTQVSQAVQGVLKTAQQLGLTIKPISLPSLKYSIATYYVIATAEASANLARFDGIRYGFRDERKGQTLTEMYSSTRSKGFGREVKQRIMLGTFTLSHGYYHAYYNKALKVRELISQEFDEAFAQVDFLISPTSPTTAFKLGEKYDDPLSMYLSDIYTIPANLAGLPAISIPCGLDKTNLPIGMQILAKRLADEELLKSAYMFEQLIHFEQHPDM